MVNKKVPSSSFFMACFFNDISYPFFNNARDGVVGHPLIVDE